MKRLTTVIVLAALLASPSFVLAQEIGDGSAQRPKPVDKLKVDLSIKTDKLPIVFRGLQMQFTAMSWTDLTFTTWALKTGRYEEVNPIAQWYVDHTGMAMLITASLDLFVHFGISALYQGNRTAAWILLIAFNVVRGYVLFHNLKVVR